MCRTAPVAAIAPLLLFALGAKIILILRIFLAASTKTGRVNNTVAKAGGKIERGEFLGFVEVVLILAERLMVVATWARRKKRAGARAAKRRSDAVTNVQGMQRVDVFEAHHVGGLSIFINALVAVLQAGQR